MIRSVHGPDARTSRGARASIPPLPPIVVGNAGLAIAMFILSAAIGACPRSGSDDDDPTTPADLCGDPASDDDDDAGGTPADDDATVDDIAEDDCLHDPLPTISICAGDPSDGETIRIGDEVGQFCGWGDESVRFVTEDGSTYALRMGDPFAMTPALPDLGRFERVRVFLDSSCAADDNPSSWTLHVSCPAAPDQTLLLLSTAEVADLARWTITSPSDVESCPGVFGDHECYEARFRKPIRFTRGGQTVELYQGEMGELDGYHIVANVGITLVEVNCPDMRPENQAFVVTPIAFPTAAECIGTR